MKNIFIKIGKITLLSLTGLFLVVALVIGSVNLLKFAIYHEYYSIESTVCRNPGLNDGFICQGLAAYEDEQNGDKMFISGYHMTKGEASRVYVTDLFDNSYYVTFKKHDGSVYKEHSGGIATTKDTAYIVSSSKIYSFSVEALLSAKNGDVLTLNEPTPIPVKGSYCYIEGDYFYTGEYHNGKQNICEHEYQVDENTTNFAITIKYHLSDLTKPLKVYSTPNKVQGFALRDDGTIVLSTSFGLANSQFLVYDETKAYDSGHVFEGAPVYFLDNPVKVIEGPAMAEGIDLYKGNFIACFESASNKYIFGKFFFAYDIVSLKITK